MMASGTALGNSGAEDVRVSRNTAVSWKHRGILISVGVDVVLGCTEVERPSRIPGSQENVRGVISFKGEILPVLSLFREPASGLRSIERTENYAIILSLCGVKCAVEVREIPRVITESQPSDSHGDKLCRMRQRHLERLIRLFVSQGGPKAATAERTGKTGQRESVRGRPDSVREVARHNYRKEPKAMSMANDGRCAFEEGVTWKRH
jgi:hypothetical protein